MKTLSILPLLALGFALAQGAEPKGASSTAPISEPASITPRPLARSNRASAQTTSRLSLPKFVPAEVRTPAADASPSAEAPEIDRPRNAIIRLPQYDVRDDQSPDFHERELLTDQGRVDLALKRHPGLKIGPLAFLNIRRGLEMLEEEQAIERRNEMSQLLAFQRSIENGRTSDSAEGNAVRAVSASTR